MNTSNFPVVGLHLDLKYLMPRKEYLLRWLDEIAACGINTLLLEYEDKFPWATYPFLRAETAWTPDELRYFLAKARALGLRVVPLVQTLSHLEFALAHPQLAHLREMPHIPTQINPSNPDAIAFVEALLEEVLTYHAEDEWVHLGGDEAWFLGISPQYSGEVQALGAQAYWIRHTGHFIDKAIRAGKRPLIWDDRLWIDLPEPIVPDLPRETILVSWDYGTRRLKKNRSTFPQVDVFRAAGFEMIGSPCLNWGVLHPMHDHCLENTQVWAAKARQAGMLGLINTSWACFHTPLPTQMPYVAATAKLLDGREEIDTGWQIDFLSEYYGASAESIPGALQELGTNWELDVGAERPITPLIYGYMDMMLHYPGGVIDRLQCGSYPLAWEEIDFVAIYRKKLDLLHRANQELILSKLGELQESYRHACSVLIPFAGAATRHQEEAQLLACLAEVKWLHAQVLRALLPSEGVNGEEISRLLTDMQSQKAQLVAYLSPFFEDESVRRLLRAWWEPAATLLHEAQR